MYKLAMALALKAAWLTFFSTAIDSQIPGVLGMLFQTEQDPMQALLLTMECLLGRLP